MDISSVVELRFLPALMEGATITVELAAASSLLSLLFALPLALLSMSAKRLLSAPARAYIEITRNVPLLIIVYLAYFGLAVAGSSMSAFACGILALTLQNSSYIAEIYRGALQSVDSRQWEGGKALGMTAVQTFTIAILPQALLKSLPALFNQIVLLLKDTSVISVISVGELLMQSKTLSEKTASTYELFLMVGAIYLILTTLVTLTGRVLERYLSFSH